MLDGGDVHWHKMKELKDNTSLKKFHGKDVGSILPNQRISCPVCKVGLCTEPCFRIFHTNTSVF